MIFNVQTRNWSTIEIIHRPDDFDEKLAPIAYLMQGYMQAFSDFLRMKHGREIRLNCGSGNRSKSYNMKVYKDMGKPNEKAATTSFHIWRFEERNGKQYAVCAGDYSSPDLDVESLFKDAEEFVTGEVYLHTSLKFVHIAWTQELDETFRA